MPSIFANSVSSLPRPTFLPGFSGVPRCRTRIDPPVTVSPPKRFTPSRCAFESRPFLLLPRPFLCAIVPPHRGSQPRQFLIPWPWALGPGPYTLRLEALAIHLDLVDLHLNEALAVALQLLVLLLPLVVEDKDLVAAALADDLGQHLRAAQLLLKLALVAAHCQHIRELQRAIVLALLNPQRVAGSHAVLLAAGTNDCVHNSNLSGTVHTCTAQKSRSINLVSMSGGACHASSGLRCQPRKPSGFLSCVRYAGTASATGQSPKRQESQPLRRTY